MTVARSYSASVAMILGLRVAQATPFTKSNPLEILGPGKKKQKIKNNFNKYFIKMHDKNF